MASRDKWKCQTAGLTEVPSIKSDTPALHTITFRDHKNKYDPGYEKTEKIKQPKKI